MNKPKARMTSFGIAVDHMSRTPPKLAPAAKPSSKMDADTDAAMDGPPSKTPVKGKYVGGLSVPPPQASRKRNPC